MGRAGGFEPHLEPPGYTRRGTRFRRHWNLEMDSG